MLDWHVTEGREAAQTWVPLLGTEILLWVDALNDIRCDTLHTECSPEGFKCWVNTTRVTRLGVKMHKENKTWVLGKINETEWYFLYFLGLNTNHISNTSSSLCITLHHKKFLVCENVLKAEDSPLLWPSICHQGRKTELWWSSCERKEWDEGEGEKEDNTSDWFS